MTRGGGARTPPGRAGVAATAMTLVLCAPLGGTVAHGADGSARVQATISGWAGAHPATGALVWRLEPTGPVTVASWRPEAVRIPASNMKLVTSAGALLALGPDHRFTTQLLAGRATVQSGRVLNGPVYLKGFGDPVLATAPYAGRYLAGRGTSFGRLAGTLRQYGIRRVRGPIVADASYFDARRTGPGWKSSYVLYASPLSALTVNQGFAGDDRSRHAADPPLAAAERLRQGMRRIGVRQSGGVRAGRAPAGAALLATTASPPLSAILRLMNVDSDNFVAETLAKGVGAHGAGAGTTAAGTAHTASLLRERGILTGRDRLVDGSGLARANRLAPASLVRLIAAADAQPAWGDALLRSLPQGGEGTLVRRFRSGPATRRVRAKTGYLNGVTALSGRVVSRRGQRYAFSIIMATSDITGARAVQDRVVTQLAAGVADRATPPAPARAPAPALMRLGL